VRSHLVEGGQPAGASAAGDHDRRALACEGESGGSPDPGARTRDQGDLARESLSLRTQVEVTMLPVFHAVNSLPHGRWHGIFHTMTTTIDAAGRLVIPAEIRREAAIEPGTPLDVRWRDGVIEIEPKPLPVSIERRGRLLVAKPNRRIARLSGAAVERVRRDLSKRRG